MHARRALLALLLSAACLLCGCESKDAPRQSSDEPYFMLDQLPQIGEYVDDTVYERKFAQYSDSIKPGLDYGKLIPYAGAFREFHFVDYGTGQWQDQTMSIAKYGVMTDSGEIVTDAIFDWVNITEISDTEYILELYQYDHTGERNERMLFCNSDGSWVMEGDAGLSFNFSAWNDGLIIVTDHSNVNYDNPSGGPSVSFFDKKGNLKFTLDNCNVTSSRGFQDGYIPVTFYSDYTSYQDTCHFVDTSGHIAFADVQPGDDFQNAIAPAQSSSNGLWGLFRADGTWLVSPGYDEFYRSEQYYVAHRDAQYTVFDLEGKVYCHFTDDNNTDSYLQVSGDHFFWNSYSYDWYTNTYTSIFTDARTGEVLRQKDTGKPVTQQLLNTQYFYLSDDAHTYLVDFEGNTVATLDTLGQLEMLNDELFSCTDGDWDSDETTITMYSFTGFQKLWSSTNDNTQSSTNYWLNGKYLIRSRYKISEDLWFYEEAEIDILNPSTGNAVLEHLCAYQVFNIGEDSYLFCSDGTYTYAYGQRMKLLMKVRNENTD